MRTHGSTQGGTGRWTAGRWATRLVGTAAVLAVAVGVAPGAASAAPVAPSDEQISAAQQAQQAAATQVGQVNAALAQAQAAVDRTSSAAELALQDYEDKQTAYDEARAAADAAAAAAAQAEVDLAGGRREVAVFARDSYKQGSTSAGTRALMTSGGPAELLERAALLDAVAGHRVDVVAQLTVLEQQATAAEDTARRSVDAADGLKAEAARLLASAQRQEAAARSQEDTLAAQQRIVEQQLAQARQTVDGLTSARQVAQAAALAEAQRVAASLVAAQPPAPAPAAPRAPSGPSTGAPSGSSGSSSSAPVAVQAPVAVPAPVAAPAPVSTTAGRPSGSAVQTAIAAARSQLGVLYSWGGGGSNGPSYGISPDTRVWGFDCSGLTEYAYAQAGIRIGGTSRDQYYRFRDSTVAVGDIQAGDLLFWDDGRANPNYLSIVHVAIYIGGGQMIEAPDRGLTVRVSTARTSSSTYFGAVRPTG